MQRTILTAVAIIAVFAIAARADVQAWDGKWFQPPEMNAAWGYDLASNVNDVLNQVVMDDWMCTDSCSPVVGFRWWGSYFLDAQEESFDLSSVEGFYISIHDDIPAGAAPSRPGVRKMEQYFTIAQMGDFCGGIHEWDIGPDFYGNTVYEYFVLFDEPFMQVEGTVYWVNIVAKIVDDIDMNVWGWHTSGRGETHNIDDAVVIGDYNWDLGTYGDDWYALEWEGESLDMAFEVLPEPSTLMLLIPGLGAVGMLARRRKK